MNSNKNILLAIALSAAVLFLWQYFVATPSMKAEQARQQQLAKQTGIQWCGSHSGARSLCHCCA